MGRTSSGDPAAAKEEEPSPPAKEQPRSNNRDSPIPAFSPSILKAVYRETSSTVKSAYADVEERIAFAVEERAVADSVAIHLLRTELAAAEAALTEALAESARLRQQVIANGKDNKSRPHPTRPYMAAAALTPRDRTSNGTSPDDSARSSKGVSPRASERRDVSPSPAESPDPLTSSAAAAASNAAAAPQYRKAALSTTGAGGGADAKSQRLARAASAPVPRASRGTTRGSSRHLSCLSSLFLRAPSLACLITRRGLVPACHRPCPYLPLSVMLDERSQNLMLAAIDDDIDVAQLEEELAELHADGGEAKPPERGRPLGAPPRSKKEEFQGPPLVGSLLYDAGKASAAANKAPKGTPMKGALTPGAKSAAGGSPPVAKKKKGGLFGRK